MLYLNIGLSEKGVRYKTAVEETAFPSRAKKPTELIRKGGHTSSGNLISNCLLSVSPEELCWKCHRKYGCVVSGLVWRGKIGILGKAWR